MQCNGKKLLEAFRKFNARVRLVGKRNVAWLERSKAEKLSGTISTKTVGKEKHIGWELRAVGCFDGKCVGRSWWVWGYFT